MAHPNVTLEFSNYQSIIPILDDQITDMNDVYFGSGSYGEVFQAKWGSQTVAIKVFRGLLIEHNTPEQKAEYINRANRELRIWAALDHPNILKLVGIYTKGKASPGALVTIYRPNGDAATFLKKNPDCDRMGIVKGIANALRYLHSEVNTIHGDVKAKNVIIHKEGEMTIPELADFGRSRVLEIGNGDTTAMRSSCRYIAPELLTVDDTRSYTAAGDIYSFGMCMLEILTGCIPFHHIRNDFNCMRLVSVGERPDRTTYPGDHITDHLWSIMVKCWDAEPANRGTMDEVIMSLDSA